MIPYLPEGPPPLDDDEDSGSPMDAPVGLQGILQNLAAVSVEPFGDFNSAFPTAAPPESVVTSQTPEEATADPSVDENDAEFEADFDAFQSATVAAPQATYQDVADKEESGKDENIAPVESPEAHDSDETSFKPEFENFQTATAPAPQNTDQEIEDVEESNLNSDLDTADNNGPNEEEEALESGDASFEADFGAFSEATNVVTDECSVPNVNVVQSSLPESEQRINHDYDGDSCCEEDQDDEFEANFEAFQAHDTTLESGESELRVDSPEVKFETAHCVSEHSEKESVKPFPDVHEDSDVAESPSNESEVTGDDDFAAFQSTSVPTNGDWAETCQQNAPEERDIFEGCEEEDSGFKFDDDSVIKTPANEDDDFGDFGDFNTTVAESETFQSDSDFNTCENHADEDDDAEFGDFSQPQEWHDSSQSKDNDDFGSFETTNTASFTASDKMEGGKGGFLEKILANMETVLKTCFESSDHIIDESFPLDSLDEEDKENEDNEGVWTFLVDFDKAFALKYQVGKSVGNDWFLKSLNIDSRNVLKNPKKSTLPIFASQLGLLEPTRGSSENLKDGIMETTVLPNDSDSTIPAPQFDWNSSGLTNPLDSTNSNFYLDLDFFETTQLKSSASTGHIKSELEEQFLCKELTNVNSQVTTEVKIDPVQSILTQATHGASVSSNPAKNCAELSSSAQAFVDSLPDLSYMKARVLMFPIAHS